ncbi:MAG: hypothetical protein HYY37_02160 [Candidatus Aenigmarchaeota archaeon]|nr:hypothetical protein [Candidatus Aenigmarchaeota archaeon]
MRNATLETRARPSIPVRDVIIGGTKRTAGIYESPDGVPAHRIVSGAEYYAKLDGEYCPVRAGENGKMYPIGA